MNSSEIRQSFLDFFKSKKHNIVNSAPVVPQDDPTLLFTNAGMNQFKDIFLGTRFPNHVRVADSQKCIRVSGKHNDLEQVGRDTYHHTFFEMLGNWSFGDYFKAEAIVFAWELLTSIWGLPKDRLYATVFKGDSADGVPRDDEAFDEWKLKTDINSDHILTFGKKDNFWEMGETGPCGPCSEIHIDRGQEFCDCNNPDKCGVNSDCARYIELWNLVFIQYNRDKNGRLETLPAKHVDTGAGFERLVAVLQGKSSNYDTDLFTPIIAQISEITGKEYSSGEDGTAFRVLADHIRALSFAIADGAIPGNEGRGYVLRRILRRAARFGRVLDQHEPFIYKLVDSLSKIMGNAYPEIEERKEYIARVIKAEEESFGRTLDRGIDIFEQKVQHIYQKGETIFPGKDAFILHDTYGFPLDLTQLMAAEKKLTVETETFHKEMEKQRQRSRSQETDYETITVDLSFAASKFIGYDVDESESIILKYEKNRLILDKTPFYAESGGQIGDKGEIKGDKFTYQVTDTRNIGQHIVHIGELEGSQPQMGDKVFAKIDQTIRRSTERNHTVTHIVHKILREVLGDHVHQAGSLVHPDYMRFDFTHFEKISQKDLEILEKKVNEKILENRKTSWKIMMLEEAKSTGAMALFGEKYGNEVRLVEIENFSKELCGGTHVRSTGEIGGFVIINETSVAAGVRRIECLTGIKTIEYLKSREKIVQQTAELLGCRPNETMNRIKVLLDEKKLMEQHVKKIRESSSKSLGDELMQDAKNINGIQLVTAQVQVSDIDELRTFGDNIREKLGSGIGVLGANIENKASIICVVTKDVIKNNHIKAGDLIKKVAACAGGGGGGSPHMALAGAKDVNKLKFALSQVEKIVKEFLDSPAIGNS